MSNGRPLTPSGRWKPLGLSFPVTLANDLKETHRSRKLLASTPHKLKRVTRLMTERRSVGVHGWVDELTTVSVIPREKPVKGFKAHLGGGDEALRGKGCRPLRDSSGLSAWRQDEDW